MIWSKDKTIILSVNGEELKVKYAIATPEQWEEALELFKGKTQFTKLCRMFVTEVEGMGLHSPEELFGTPGAYDIIIAIGKDILESSTVDVTLKNA